MSDKTVIENKKIYQDLQIKFGCLWKNKYAVTPIVTPWGKGFHPYLENVLIRQN